MLKETKHRILRVLLGASELGMAVRGFVALFALGGGAVWFAAHQESSTYNKLTGAETTTWDAIWVTLRVQDTPKERR